MLGCSEEFNVSFGFIGVKGKAIKNRVDQFNQFYWIIYDCVNVISISIDQISIDQYIELRLWSLCQLLFSSYQIRYAVEMIKSEQLIGIMSSIFL